MNRFGNKPGSNRNYNYNNDKSDGQKESEFQRYKIFFQGLKIYHKVDKSNKIFAFFA